MYTVADLLTSQAKSRGDRPAVLDGGVSTTYSELLDLSLRCRTLVGRYVQPGQRVTIILPRSVDAVAAYFAAHFAGAVPVIISERLRARQIAHIVDHCEAALVLTDSRHRRLLRDAHLPAGAVVDVARIREAPSCPSARPLSRDLASLTYTSGSTGTPKGVALSHANLVAGARIVADYLHLGPEDRTVAVLPWNFDYGLNQVLATFAVGGTVIIQRSTFATDIHHTLTSTRATGLAGVPSLWSSLSAIGSPFTKGSLPYLRYITNSGGPLAVSSLHRIRSAHPHLAVYLMYGLTEAFRSTYLDPALIDDRPGSIGKAIPDTQIMVLDDHGNACGAGVVGELVHRGPTVALGYWDDPDASRAVFRPHPMPGLVTSNERVVHSGDYVRADEDGYLFYIGRRDEMFKSRGVRTTPGEIEGELLGSGMIDEVVVAAVAQDGPDPVLVAAVTLRGPEVTTEDVRDYSHSEIPSHLQPHIILAMDCLPTTSSGKTDRAKIRDELAVFVQTGGR